MGFRQTLGQAALGDAAVKALREFAAQHQRLVWSSAVCRQPEANPHTQADMEECTFAPALNARSIDLAQIHGVRSSLVYTCMLYVLGEALPFHCSSAVWPMPPPSTDIRAI